MWASPSILVGVVSSQDRRRSELTVFEDHGKLTNMQQKRTFCRYVPFISPHHNNDPGVIRSMFLGEGVSDPLSLREGS